MTFDRGDLLLVPFPFTDLSASKKRPVLALTGPDGYGDFIARPVTSRPHHARSLPILQSDLISGVLPVASWVRVDRIVTLNAGLVVKSVAGASDAFARAAIRRLCEHLGEARS